MGRLLLVSCALVACNPTLNWREYRSADGQYAVLFPAKPEQFSRAIDLNGTRMTMTMTAAEVDGATFAVGSAELANADQAQGAVTAMKTALVNNIRGTVRMEKSASAASAATGQARRQLSTEIEAVGSKPDGTAMMLAGRFLARDRRIYQVIVMTKDKQLGANDIEMFLHSFRLD